VKPYRHIVVDEAQDLHEAQWRLLRAAVVEGPNDMFIVGDSHQRIYDRRTTLSRVGISIRGRSHRLRINYRTTHEILRFAMVLLGEEEFDDLDGELDAQTTSTYHSFLHGDDPVLSASRTGGEQLGALSEQIGSWLADGVAEHEIGIACRQTRDVDRILSYLNERGIRAAQLSVGAQTSSGVSVGTMHRMKGLEFRYVAVAHVDDETVPMRWALADKADDAAQHRSDLLMERCLLYVACTRAREGLWVGWHGQPSRFLGGLVDP
jgi:superfamily I DNA/RNA helicase